MSRHVIFGNDELVIRFSGLTALAGLKHELKIPYSSIKNVQAGNFKLHWNALRLFGTSIPNGYKAGRFIYKGQKYFLSYNDASQVVVLDLEGYDYDKVVVQIGTPKQIKQAILKRCPQLA
ncbi:PH domain-containing protein [Aneurinibacillus tyrosinisolvens]|uniref:PH domain-containing protein n=1 Tax=Aneurinibacillus tyrosinisolvens TaxID=1443435 RepID=UPI00063EE5CD|nr:PH domain-containing protein [Aneurinibacillus tyrosinisolvens]